MNMDGLPVKIVERMIVFAMPRSGERDQLARGARGTWCVKCHEIQEQTVSATADRAAGPVLVTIHRAYSITVAGRELRYEHRMWLKRMVGL